MMPWRIPGSWRARRHGTALLVAVALGSVGEATGQQQAADKVGSSAAKCAAPAGGWRDELRGPTLADALQGTIPGVTVASGAGTVRIRGANSVQSNTPLLFVDHVRVHALPASGLYGVPLFEFVDVAEIEHIEVLRGPAATLRYGDGASAGVINISTRRGRSVRDDIRGRDCQAP